MDAKQPKQQESYMHDYDGALTKTIIAGRTAETHGAFVLPYLRTGMNLLDCGCGPGTITVGLAQTVSPGKVTGIDLEESQLELARENATKLALTNVKFDSGSVYELPYEASQFDAIFCHALLTHMHDPLAVLNEMWRVLKPGGIVGIRSTDLGATLMSPANPTLDKAYDIWLKYRRHRGGDPLIGRRFRALLREAGFVKTIGSASSEAWGTLQKTQSLVPVLVDEFTGPRIAETAIKMGWTDQLQMDNVASALADWGNHPDAFIAVIGCEAVGWKE